MRRPLGVILTHDVDWPPQGPGVNHVLARRERFDETVISRVVREGFNPYNGISELMNIERELGVRSTFFFRPKYDDGVSIEDYQETVRDLVRGRWEIGVHVNDASTLESIAEEKKIVERVAGETWGSRVHYLKVHDLSLFEAAGFKYDSSCVFRRDAIDVRNMGFIKVGGLIVFPITIMDTYLFSYMHVTEENVLETINEAVETATQKGYMTILWHDCSIRMKGGREYPQILKALASTENVSILRAKDAYDLIMENKPKENTDEEKAKL
jgi:peptidoglycan/xylan/chitin deacetylase (PgdA/CDA1 family)